MSILRYYSRPGCGLCEDAEPSIRALASRYDLELQIVDITASDDLMRRHGERIPVVELDGVEIGFGRLRLAAVEATLRSRRGSLGE